MFADDIKALKQIVERYRQEQAQLFQEHPELPVLKTWLHKSYEEHYEANKSRLDSIAKYNAEHADTLPTQRNLMKLKRPEALLEVMNDPQFSAWFNDVFDVAGLKNSIGSELKDWDKQAGYKPANSQENSIHTVAELQTALNSRIAAYQKAYSYQSAQSALPSFVIDQIPADVTYGQYRDTARLYLESYYGGPLEHLRTEFNVLTSKMNSTYPWNAPFAQQWKTEFQQAALAYGDAGKQ